MTVSPTASVPASQARRPPSPRLSSLPPPPPRPPPPLAFSSPSGPCRHRGRMRCVRTCTRFGVSGMPLARHVLAESDAAYHLTPSTEYLAMASSSSMSVNAKTQPKTIAAPRSTKHCHRIESTAISLADYGAAAGEQSSRQCSRLDLPPPPPLPELLSRTACRTVAATRGHCGGFVDHVAVATNLFRAIRSSQP